MASFTLGLDIGVNSVGWALVDIDGMKTVAAGVRVFPEGVARDQQGGEKSKTQERRTARGTRRQIHRRSRRRYLLRKALTDVGLLPADPVAYQRLVELNPYQLRCRAVSEKVDLHELGRALQHLNQRRGYLSNRKTDKASSKDTQGVLKEMSELAATMQQAHFPTLGSFFSNLEKTFDHCNRPVGPHIRRRPTKREMYVQEFEHIWTEQQRYYPDILTDALKYGIKGKQRFPKKPTPLGKRTALAEYGLYGLMFFQRKMYWPKSVVGRCELESKEKRCPRAARIAQRFRIVQEVNNIRLLDRITREERPLAQDERTKVISRLMESKEVRFDQIRTLLGLPETVRFNFETTRKKLDGHLSDATLSGKKHLGQRRWKELAEGVKNRIVDILIEEDQEQDVLQRLGAECGLTAEEAASIAGVNFPEGYMSFSRKAIEKLLPHLENGLTLMANDASDSALHAAGYLRADERVVNQRQFLPPSPDVTNPIVRQSLVEVRKIINAILRELVYRGGHSLKEIHVELAREAKKSFEERRQLRFDNAARRDAREEAKKDIEERWAGKVKPTHAAVNRYLLWQIQKEHCPYCGQKISPEQLFNGDADIDHILPRWRSLDDSMGNKVVAHCRCNQDKGDCTPREWLEHSDPQRYEQVMQFAERHLSYSKQRKFTQVDIELKDFVHRQLTDTAYISRCVSQYLQCLGAKVVCVRGDMTAGVRHWWGLNSILQSDGSDKKNREDHRHHAIDALAIAMIDSKRLFALANNRGEAVVPPWDGFRREIEQVVQSINVSHRVQRRLHGALHKDTFYGATQKRGNNEVVSQEQRPWAKGWIEDAGTFVRRKSLDDLTKTQDLEKVRDATIYGILKEHLRNRGIALERNVKLPSGVFTGVNMPRMPSGVPIKKVRMIERSDMARSVSPRRAFQFVEPGSNHHMVIFDVLDKQGKPKLNTDGTPKRDGDIVTMMDAAIRVANMLNAQRGNAERKTTLIDRDLGPGKKFVMSLSINEMFLLSMPNGSQKLHRIQKLSKGSIILRPHTYAGKVSDRDKPPIIQRCTPNTLRGKKVTVDLLGRIRWAND